MKKWIKIIMIGLLTVSLAACGPKKTESFKIAEQLEKEYEPLADYEAGVLYQDGMKENYFGAFTRTYEGVTIADLMETYGETEEQASIELAYAEIAMAIDELLPTVEQGSETSSTDEVNSAFVGDISDGSAYGFNIFVFKDIPDFTQETCDLANVMPMNFWDDENWSSQYGFYWFIKGNVVLMVDAKWFHDSLDLTFDDLTDVQGIFYSIVG